MGFGIALGRDVAGLVVDGAKPKSRPRYCLDDSDGHRLGVVTEDSDSGEMAIQDVRGTHLARVAKAELTSNRKQWSSGNHFAVEFPILLEDPFRSLVFATAVAISPVKNHLEV